MLEICKNDLAKALCITLIPSVATIVYAAMCGGNSVAFLANYVILAMTMVYLIKIYIVLHNTDGKHCSYLRNIYA